METTPAVATLTIALLTTPALAGGAISSVDDESSAWLSEAKLQINSPGAEMGREVAIDDNAAAVALPAAAEVRLYERSTPGWQEEAVLRNFEAGSSFASSVSIDEDTIAVGANLARIDGDFSGAVYVYEKDGNGWDRTATLHHPDGNDFDRFGTSLDLQGNKLAIGSTADDRNGIENAGTVFVFHREDQGWSLEAQLSPPPSEADRRLGISLALDGETLLAGTAGSGGLVFELQDDAWEHRATLNVEAASGLGRSVALADGIGALGAPQSASVDVFEQDGDTWSHAERLHPVDLSPTQVDGYFGSALDLSASGEILAVGAPGDDPTPSGTQLPASVPFPCYGLAVATSCQRAGSVYVLETSAGESWHHRAKISPPDGRPADLFGQAVSIDEGGDALIAGAPRGPFVSDDHAGAAYIFADALEQPLATQEAR